MAFEFHLPASETFGPNPLRVYALTQLANGGWAILGREYAGRQAQRPLHWLRADATGLIVEQRTYEQEGKSWELRQDPAGAYFQLVREVSPLFRSPPSSGGQDIAAIQAATGEPLDLPVEEIAFGTEWDQELLMRRDLPPLPRGWQPVRPTRIQLAGTFAPLFIQPMVLAEESDFLSTQWPATLAPAWTWDEAVRQFARARQWCWKQYYSEEDFAAFAQQSIRLQALELQFHEDQKVRLALAELAPFAADTPAYRAETLSKLPLAGNPSMPRQSIEIRMPLAVRRLEDGRLLIVHRLQHPPTEVSASPILRIGLASADSEVIDWLGWLPWPADQPLNAPNGYARFPQVGRLGDQLILCFMGSTAQGNPTKSHIAAADFQWLAVPLPDSCANLPEGPW